MKTGDKVKLIGMPPNLADDNGLRTRALFEKCLGHVFTVVGVDTVEGYTLIELNVGHIVGRPDYMESIWVEPEYLQICGK